MHRTWHAVVAAGGGVKGARTLAPLRQIVRSQTPDAWFGVSTGALTAAFMAQGKSRLEYTDLVNRLESLYLGIRGTADIVSPPWPGGLLGKVRGLGLAGALYRFDGLRRLVRQQVDPAAIRTGAHVEVGVVCLESGAFQSIPGADPDFLQFVVASAAQPLMVPPERIRGLSWVDGGVRNITPLAPAARWLRERMGPLDDAVMHVLLTGALGVEPIPTPQTGPAILGRVMGLLVNEVIQTDLAQLVRTNVAAREGEAEGKRVIRVEVWEPEAGYHDGFDFDPQAIRRMLAEGTTTRPWAALYALPEAA